MRIGKDIIKSLIRQNQSHKLPSKDISNDKEREINEMLEFKAKIANTINEWDTLKIEQTSKLF